MARSVRTGRNLKTLNIILKYAYQVWVYKRILSTENHPINITKFGIPQVIAGESPVKFDWMIVVIHYPFYITFQKYKDKIKQLSVQVAAVASLEVFSLRDASGNNLLFQWILRWCFTRKRDCGKK